MKDRSAIDTIKGYFYQFDYSIIRILELTNDNDSISIERIEDVDISTATSETAVQCKYYSKTEYNHSVIAKPIRYMLKHFKNLKDNDLETVNYLLYGYYNSGQEKLTLPLSLEFLKSKFLSYTKNKISHILHNELNITDDELNEFIIHLTIDINAKSYDEQLSDINKRFKENFSCSDFEAEHYYYNSALKIIKDISVESDKNKRVISKKEFLNKIDTKAILFNMWFIKFKGSKQYFSELRNTYFSNLNTSPFDRYFLIEIDKNNYDRSELKELIFIISSKWSKITKRTTSPFCPFLYIEGIENSELINLKSELFSEGFNFVDGFDFSGADFNPKSINKKPNFNNGIVMKFLNKSTFIDMSISEITSTKEIYQFYLKSPFYQNDSVNLKHIKIQINELKNIKEII